MPTTMKNPNYCAINLIEKVGTNDEGYPKFKHIINNHYEYEPSYLNMAYVFYAVLIIFKPIHKLIKSPWYVKFFILAFLIACFLGYIKR